MVLRFNSTSSKFIPSTLSYNILTDLPNLSVYITASFLTASLSNYATTTSLADKQSTYADPYVEIITDLNDFSGIRSGDYYLESITDIVNNASIPADLISLTSGIFLSVKKGTNNVILQEIYSPELTSKYNRTFYNNTWSTWLLLSTI
jgi:hypothetical protein